MKIIVTRRVLVFGVLFEIESKMAADKLKQSMDIIQEVNASLVRYYGYSRKHHPPPREKRRPSSDDDNDSSLDVFDFESHVNTSAASNQGKGSERVEHNASKPNNRSVADFDDEVQSRNKRIKERIVKFENDLNEFIEQIRAIGEALADS